MMNRFSTREGQVDGVGDEVKVSEVDTVAQDRAQDQDQDQAVKGSDPKRSGLKKKRKSNPKSRFCSGGINRPRSSLLADQR